MRNIIDNSVLDSNKQLETTKANEEYHWLGTKNIKKLFLHKKGLLTIFKKTVILRKR